MNILITGGAGFIGSHLAAYHLAKGDAVHVIDDLSTGQISNIEALFSSPDFQFEEASILTWDGLKEAVRWSHRIYHMAAIVGVKKVLEDPRAVMATNMAGTERVFRAAAEVNPMTQIIVASSSEVYGFNTKPAFVETDDIVLRSAGRLRWCYAVTKLADEFLAYSFLKKSHIKVVIARLFNTVGPHQTGKYGMVFPNFIRQAVHGEQVTVFGDGSQTRSFCNVDDTVKALDLLACTPAANGEIVNVGNDHEISIGNLAKLIIERSSSPSKVHYVSYETAYGLEFEDITHRRPVIQKLQALTGFTPRRSLEETIDQLISLERKSIQG
jgi:UDP-glucose 4-epimerase